MHIFIFSVWWFHSTAGSGALSREYSLAATHFQRNRFTTWIWFSSWKACRFSIYIRDWATENHQTSRYFCNQLKYFVRSHNFFLICYAEKRGEDEYSSSSKRMATQFEQPKVVEVSILHFQFQFNFYKVRYLYRCSYTITVTTTWIKQGWVLYAEEILQYEKSISDPEVNGHSNVSFAERLRKKWLTQQTNNTKNVFKNDGSTNPIYVSEKSWQIQEISADQGRIGHSENLRIRKFV